MTAHVRAQLLLVLSTLAVCAVAYPVAVWAFAWAVVPTTAAGGGPAGSPLVAQEFKSPGYFRPRPSAAGYAANASSGSNLAGTNPKLRERVVAQLDADYKNAAAVPADAVTTSGSGLDPHLTLAAARLQVARVAGARSAAEADVTAVLSAAAFTPLGGLAGDPLVNVLEVNLVLDARFPAAAK